MVHLWYKIRKDVQLRCRCLMVISFFLCSGACVSGHDDSPGDHPSANAADSSAASIVSTAASSTSSTAASSYVTAGNVGYLLWIVSLTERIFTSISSTSKSLIFSYFMILSYSNGIEINVELFSLYISYSNCKCVKFYLHFWNTSEIL